MNKPKITILPCKHALVIERSEPYDRRSMDFDRLANYVKSSSIKGAQKIVVLVHVMVLSQAVPVHLFAWYEFDPSLIS